MAGYRLSEAAQADLQDIRRYTLDRWGAQQARHYLVELALRFEQLAATLELGRTREDLQAGIRSFNARHHTIFYRKSADGIDIVRVLHPSMDIRSHFSPDRT